jgi:hypothetical protein
LPIPSDFASIQQVHGLKSAPGVAQNVWNNSKCLEQFKMSGTIQNVWNNSKYLKQFKMPRASPGASKTAHRNTFLRPGHPFYRAFISAIS